MSPVIVCDLWSDVESCCGVCHAVPMAVVGISCEDVTTVFSLFVDRFRRLAPFTCRAPWLSPVYTYGHDSCFSGTYGLVIAVPPYHW